MFRLQLKQIKYVLIKVYPAQHVSILVSIFPTKLLCVSTSCVIVTGSGPSYQFVPPRQIAPTVGEISVLKWDKSSECPSQETAYLPDNVDFVVPDGKDSRTHCVRASTVARFDRPYICIRIYCRFIFQHAWNIISSFKKMWGDFGVMSRIRRVEVTASLGRLGVRRESGVWCPKGFQRCVQLIKVRNLVVTRLRIGARPDLWDPCQSHDRGHLPCCRGNTRALTRRQYMAG